MRGSTHSDNLQEAKPNAPSQRYPVSARAYKKKDYDYLSTFSRAAHPGLLRSSPLHHDGERSHDRSDSESDLFMTPSSVEYATSASSSSSTSSYTPQNHAKYGVMTIIPDIDHDPEVCHPDCYQPPQHHCHHHHHQHTHHHHHHIQTSKMTTLSSTDWKKPDLEKPIVVESAENEANINAVQDDKSEAPAAADSDSVQVKVQRPRTRRTKVKPRPTDAAVLPKFGSWDTRNPSSGEAYTLIFRRLRDEKKSGGLPVCGSPTHPKVDEVDESLGGQENKEKEPLHSTPGAAKKYCSRSKAKATSCKEAAPHQPRLSGECEKRSLQREKRRKVVDHRR